MIIHADSNGAKCVVYVKFRVRFFLSQAHALIACLDGSSPNMEINGLGFWFLLLLFFLSLLFFFKYVASKSKN